MARGFVYLTAVVDVASRKVLAHKVAITLEACHAVEVLEQAFARYGTPELVNTDQGSQFTAEDFTEVVLKRGCKRLMDGRGAWRERAACPRGITCSSNGCGAVSNTNACISRPMTASVPPGPTSGATSTGSTRKGRIRVSRTSRRNKPTGAHCPTSRRLHRMNPWCAPTRHRVGRSSQATPAAVNKSAPSQPARKPLIDRGMLFKQPGPLLMVMMDLL